MHKIAANFEALLEDIDKELSCDGKELNQVVMEIMKEIKGDNTTIVDNDKAILSRESVGMCLKLEEF